MDVAAGVEYDECTVKWWHDYMTESLPIDGVRHSMDIDDHRNAIESSTRRMNGTYLSLRHQILCNRRVKIIGIHSSYFNVAECCRNEGRPPLIIDFLSLRSKKSKLLVHCFSYSVASWCRIWCYKSVWWCVGRSWLIAAEFVIDIDRFLQVTRCKFGNAALSTFTPLWIDLLLFLSLLKIWKNSEKWTTVSTICISIFINI